VLTSTATSPTAKGVTVALSGDLDQRISPVFPTAAGSETPASSFLSYDLLIGDEWLRGPGPWRVAIHRRSRG
jgi:hypothetical protein